MLRLLIVICLICPELWAFELSTQTFADATYTIVKADVHKDQLALFLKGPNGKPYGGFAHLKQALNAEGMDLVFAMNAGMFDPNHFPVGLFVSNNREYNPINFSNGSGNFYMKPNGCFAECAGQFLIARSENFSKAPQPVTFATQSGPMLVEDRKIHPIFSKSSKSLNIRNGVGTLSPSKAVFVISEQPVTFYAFAHFMRDGLGCDNALYLDGAISSIYAPSLQRNDDKYQLGPIIGIITKLEKADTTP